MLWAKRRSVPPGKERGRMRLIDADELTKDRVENDPVRIAAMCAPTAFGKEKVIEIIVKGGIE